MEEWIRADRPLQWQPTEDRKLQRKQTALQIAVERRFHSLAALLLANGYNPNGDYFECISSAVRARDSDMVELLLRFGADPKSVDFATVLETCDRALMDRFIDAGVDPCADNATARAISSGRRPILGFIKQYRDRFPGLQRQIDIALHAFTSEASPRGVALMLWLGADPHADVPSSAYDEGRYRGIGDTAFESALWGDKPEIIAMVMKRPIPKPKLHSLLRLAAHRKRPELVERLLEEGADPNDQGEDDEPVLYSFISALMWRPSFSSADDQPRGMKSLELVLEAGAKWQLSERRIRWLRRDLAQGESKVVVRMLDLLHEHGAISEEQLYELTRTPAVRKVLNGYTKPPRHQYTAYQYSPAVPAAPSPATDTPRPGYWKRHWSQR